MLAFRRVISNVIIACAVTITVLVQAVLIPLALWFMPEREAKEIRNGLRRN